MKKTGKSEVEQKSHCTRSVDRRGENSSFLSRVLKHELLKLFVRTSLAGSKTVIRETYTRPSDFSNDDEYEVQPLATRISKMY